MSDLAVKDGTTLDFEPYRSELTGYCYRMLGSAFDADDAVQETLVRAWQAFDRFEGRSAVRSWLYRIATNVCLDALRSRQRRALPMDFSPAVPASSALGEALPEATWITPLPGSGAGPEDPAERAVASEGIRLAFIAALQFLPPRQRSVLILREVLSWQASEVAELLDTSVASVNSLLQRARATLATSTRQEGAVVGSEDLDADDRALLDRYLVAFERYDIESLVALLHEDASLSMPPFALWLRGRDSAREWYLGTGIGCKDSRLVPLVANGMPAFGHYKPSGPGGDLEPWAVQVLEVRGGKVAHIHHFLTNLDGEGSPLFERFGLPASPA